MTSFIYVSGDGSINIKLDDDRLIDKVQRDIIGEVKLAATNEDLERVRDMVIMAIDLEEIIEERKRILEKVEEERQP